MPVLHIVVLALVQGITEFLPISSHAHLQLVSAFTGWPDQGLMIDVAVHVGTLGAVVVYFWHDVRMAVAGIPRMIYGKMDTPGANLAFLLMVTLGLFLAGVLVGILAAAMA